MLSQQKEVEFPRFIPIDRKMIRSMEGLNKYINENEGREESDRIEVLGLGGKEDVKNKHQILFINLKKQKVKWQNTKNYR